MGLFYGPNGSGKTVAGASFPGPIMIWDFDGRVEPVTAFYPNREDIDYWTVGLDGDARSDVIGFSEFCDRFNMLQDKCPYSTILIDSYTMYSAVAIWHQMGLRKKEELKMTKGGLPIPDWDEFKGETAVFLKILEISKILPCHVICTAHPVVRARTTKQTGSVNEILASMVRASTLATYGWKTESFIPDYFNEIYYFHVDVTSQVAISNRFMVQTVSAGEIMAKTALLTDPKIPGCNVAPTFEITGRPFYPILQAILKEKKGIEI